MGYYSIYFSNYYINNVKTRPNNNILFAEEELENYKLGDDLDSRYHIDDFVFWLWLKN